MYRVHILGLEQDKHKKDFWDISKNKVGGQHNYNIFALSVYVLYEKGNNQIRKLWA